MDRLSIFKRDKLPIYESEMDALKNLSDDQVGRIFMAVFDLMNGHEPQGFDPLETAIALLLFSGKSKEGEKDG